MIKISELIGAKLDYWVGKAADKDVYIDYSGEGGAVCFTKDSSAPWFGELPYRPSTDWMYGGLIIEQEKIMPRPTVDGTWYAEVPLEIKEDDIYAEGPTPLIAAMRCYVATKFGEEVEDV